MQAARVVLSGGLVLVLAYLIGSTPWGFLIARLKGVDIREHGSGNIGATNVRRVLGKKWGILCFLPVLLVGMLLGGKLQVGGDLGALLAAAAAVIGHVWPVWLRFKGGKGVATTIGALIAVSWVAVASALIVWLALFFLTRYVSLASLCAAVMLPLGFVLAGILLERPVLVPTLVLLILLALLIIYRHRSNMKRLLQGTEYRFERKRRTAP